MFAERDSPEPEAGSTSLSPRPHHEIHMLPASDDGNAEPALATGSDESTSEVEVDLATPPVAEPSEMNIPEDTKTWVKAQIPKKKTGTGILGLAKSNNRKDIEAVKRYVNELVAAGTIPMSGKKGGERGKGKALPKPLATTSQSTAEKQLEAVDVLISEIRKDAQIRTVYLNEANVLRLMENFDATDPIHLFERPEGEKDLADGHHRVEAATRLGRTTIRAFIHKGTMCDTLIFAYRINDRNGIPLTKPDRVNALIMIKNTPEGRKLTGDQLAEQLGVSRQTIQTYLAEIRDGKVGGTKKRASKDEATLRAKAVAALTRMEDRFGLALFRDFVEALDEGKRTELRAMLDGESE